MAHAKNIHHIFSLYGRTFPYRLMTYQVSYCIFIAATVEAYGMKLLAPEPAREAAKRLKAAIQILEDETRHTPGISRSLDTIRRRLAIWKPREAESSGTHHDLINAGIGSEATSLSTHELDNTGGEHQNALGNDGAHLNTGMSNVAIDPASVQVTHNQNSFAPLHPDSLVAENGLGFAVPRDFDLSGLVTGQGFHPDAFCWSVADLMGMDNPEAFF